MVWGEKKCILEIETILFNLVATTEKKYELWVVGGIPWVCKFLPIKD